jgi:transcriptional regulator GlxA family with amidase domain
VAKKTLFAGVKPTRRGAPARPHLVAVVAFDGVVLGDLATPLEIFGLVRNAEGQRCYEVRTCSHQPQVESEHVTLRVPWRLSSLKRADTVIIPGIDNIDRPLPGELLRALRAAVSRGARVASICTGAFILARTSALDGLKATTHWLVAQELARRHPTIDVDADVLYVDNGSVLTSAGAAAGFDLCLHLVRRDLGAEIAARAARAAVMPLERSGGQAQFIVYEQPAVLESMGPLLLWLGQNVGKHLSLSAIARHAAMSTRTLSRRFLEQVGTTPVRWIAGARVRRAQQLLETTGLSIEQVATEVGFRSASVLREHFGGIVGTTPLAYRRAFGNAESAESRCNP